MGIIINIIPLMYNPFPTLAVFALITGAISPISAQSLDRKVVGEMGLWNTAEQVDLTASPQGGMRATAHSNLERINWTGAITAPVLPNNSIVLLGWRGERVNAQIAISCDQDLHQLRLKVSPLKSSHHDITPKASFVKFTKAQGTPVADIISNKPHESISNPKGVNRSIWVSIDIPSETKSGIFNGEIQILAEGQDACTIPITLHVTGHCLPTPKNWSVHLDLWQHSDPIARWHQVEMWSDAHFALLKPLMQRLAQAGQKVITCSIIDEAWGGQTYDHYASMIEWIRQADGTMRWDYSNFDKYVHFMMEDVGIREQISCYSMVPWSQKLRVFDEASGEYKVLPCIAGTADYEQLWSGFIRDFAQHVTDKGWADICCIALDERPDHMVRAAKKVIDTHAPQFKIVSAVDRPSAASDIVYDMSPSILHANMITPELLQERKSAGKKTTFYICCNPPRPNTFTQSPIHEAEWLGMFAGLHRLDGFLRWAYSSWNRDPMDNTDFGKWESGDCFLVYPNNQSSLRFEKLRDGLEEFEKLQVLRARAESDTKLQQALQEMEAKLTPYFDSSKIKELDFQKAVQRFREELEQLCK